MTGAQESVDTFMSGVGIRSIEPLVGALQQLYSKYKFMETNLQKSRESFKRKIPETQKDLEALQHLMAKQDEGEALQTRFNLADNVYAHATIDPAVGKVCIWLGVRLLAAIVSVREAVRCDSHTASCSGQRHGRVPVPGGARAPPAERRDRAGPPGKVAGRGPPSGGIQIARG